MTPIHFEPRWKEELVASSSEGTLVFEFTMGEYHVYFPSQRAWLASVPEWAKPQWQHYFDQCSNWCKANRVPITVKDNGYVYELKASSK